MELVLKATTRETGKGAARRLRREGELPAVVYGKGAEPVAVAVDHVETVRLLSAAGRNAIFRLQLSGQTMDVMVKEVQRNVFNGIPRHIDFTRIVAGQRVTVGIRITVIGDEEIIKEGLLVQQYLRELDVECLAIAVPEVAVADVSGLTIGDSVTVAQLRMEGEGDIQQAADEVVVAIVAPRAAVEDEAEEADDDAAAEPAEETEEA